MKKIPILLFILLLASCGVNDSDSVSHKSSNSSLEETNITSEQITTDNVNSSSAENLVDDVYLMDEPYSFDEVNQLLEPTSFSVNELSEVFGEPTSMYGYCNESDPENTYYVISVRFKDVMVDLATKNGEKLDFTDIYSSGRDDLYLVPDSELDTQLYPKCLSVLSGDWNLPRGIKLGDCVESLYDAYNGNMGEERSAQGQFLVSYDYGESGSIIYYFDDIGNGDISGLTQVTIEWYSTSVPDSSLESANTPLP